MKTIICLFFLVALAPSVLAQRPLTYTVWVDGLVNPKLAKSALYFLGTGVRGEVSKPVGQAGNALFVQFGYARFFQKSTSAFTANIGLVNVGYRYQSRKALTASAGVGVQYWSERMRLRFPDYALDETLTSLMPAATAGLGFRLKPRCVLGLEYRALVKPESGTFVLNNNIALSVGYTL